MRSGKGKSHWGIAGLVTGTMLLTACASMEGAEFARPEVPTKDVWTEDLGQQRDIEFDWWRRFGDPYLEDLIERAIANNADLRVLARRSDIAKADISRARSGLFPTVTAGAATRTTRAWQFPSVDQTQYGIGSEMAWELDVWGKTRKGIEAQDAAYQGSLADWRAGHLALVSDVAIAYLQLRLLDEQIDRQKEAIDRGSEILGIYTEMHDAGLIPQADMLFQKSELNAQRAGLIDLERSRQLTENGLATLLGEPAGNLDIPDTATLMDIQAVTVPAGLPSEILDRRPDIVAAEYDLLQACKLDAQARRAQLPSIGLTGIGGTAAYSLEDLFKTTTLGLGSFIKFPVFDPAVRAQIRVAEAQVLVAEEQYRAVVFRAFEDVENALTNVSKRKEQSTEFEERVVTLTEAEQQVKEQLELGLVPYLTVLEGQRSRLDAEQQFLINRWQILMDTVTLFKAVGGGWPPEQVGSR